MLVPILTELRPNSAKNGSKSTIFVFHSKNVFFREVFFSVPGGPARGPRQEAWQAGRLAGRPARWPAGWLAGRLAGRQAGWPAGQLASRPAGRPASRPGLPAGKCSQLY